MARREWAEKEARKRLQPSEFDEYSCTYESALKREHARAVRVVKARDKWLMGGGYDNMSPDFQAGYHQACHHILAALTKGRA